MTDDAVAKRAAGKSAVQASILWTITIDAVSIRCRRSADNALAVEAKFSTSSWIPMPNHGMRSPEELFDLATCLPLVRAHLAQLAPSPR